jgi:NADH-quinone oxidoreductase subunit N
LVTINIGSADFAAILPIIILSVFGVYLMVQGVFAPRMNKLALAYLGIIGILIALVSNFFLIGKSYTAFEGMVRVDHLTVVFNFIFMITAAMSLLLITSYSEQEHIEFIEFTPLILFSTVGMMLMGSAESLMTIFLGLETMSIALYVLAGFRRTNRYSLEAALKYFLLGAFATGFLLYGIALLYGAVGSTNLTKISEYVAQNSMNLNLLALLGMGLIIIGFGFKVALVPFHMWTPDVYQGSPIPVTAYMAVGAKAAGFAAILRVIVLAAGQAAFEWTPVLWVLAVLTMTVGNIIALVQDDIKRMLAYSSIAHAGYILMGVVAGNDSTVSSVMFYLVVYLFMNLGAFAVVGVVSGKNERYVKIKYFSGLGKTQPMLAFVMTICMFSLAGFPPTGGFMGKFFLFKAALQSGYVWLVIFGAINTLISVYYYIRVVVAMYMHDPLEDQKVEPIMAGAGLVILVSILGIFYLGIFPGTTMSILY